MDRQSTDYPSTQPNMDRQSTGYPSTQPNMDRQSTDYPSYQPNMDRQSTDHPSDQPNMDRQSTDYPSNQPVTREERPPDSQTRKQKKKRFLQRQQAACRNTAPLSCLGQPANTPTLCPRALRILLACWRKRLRESSRMRQRSLQWTSAPPAGASCPPSPRPSILPETVSRCLAH